MKKLTNLIIVFVAAVACLDACFNGEFPLVAREDFVAAENENKELRTSLNDLQQSYAKQNADLNYILSELASISNRTSRIRLESGESPMSEMDFAKDDLSSLKGKIDRLEKEAARVRRLDKSMAISQKTINELRETVANQEREIARLRKENAEQAQTITTQHGVISSQKDTISLQTEKLRKQKDELSRQVWRQAELLYSAGVQFGRIADEGDFKIVGRRNKENVLQYRIKIYQEAEKMYRAASAQGHQAARDSVISLGYKLKYLN